MKRRNLYWILTSLIFIALLAVIFTQKEEKPLKISILDIGQGDAIFIQTPNNKTLLIDAGRDRTVLSELGDSMAATVSQIDTIEISNPDLDHIGGFPFVMEKYRVNRIISAGTNHESLEAFEKIENLAKEKRIPVDRPKSDTKYVIDSKANVTYTILWPEENVRDWEINAGSIIGLLEYSGHKVLLTGDAPKEVEDELVKKYPELLRNIDILKVGHHGSRTSTGTSLAKLARPKYALISAGLNNRYGHPHKETIDTLQKVGAKILVTSEDGRIVCNIYTKKGSCVQIKLLTRSLNMLQFKHKYEA